jgi:FkbM family methyltransferase
MFKKLSEKKSTGSIQTEEIAIIKKCISKGDVVFDIGAHHGEWSEAVSKKCECYIHMFEASPEAFNVLKKKNNNNYTINNLAASDKSGNLAFHVYRDDPRLSSAHRRISVEDTLLVSGYDTYEVTSTSVDDYWPIGKGMINFLKVDVKGSEYEVLRGARKLLRRGAINYIQFEYGGTFANAGTSLKLVYYYLRRFGYHLFEVKGNKFKEIPEFRDGLEHFEYTKFLAVNERHLTKFKKENQDIEIYFLELEKLQIQLNGVIHVGAHQGQEVSNYRNLGISPIVLIEANPKLAKDLHKKFDTASDIEVIEGAISDTKGKVTFNVASFDQSSSLLNLKKHAKLYPKITYTDSIEVEAFTLNQCIADLSKQRSDVSEANLLVMDIQGAELMALRGGVKTLEQIDAIQLEVNYAEFYEGCPSIWDIDAFLEPLGFIRYKTNTPYSPDWGDALYVRRPIIANSNIGNMGRFGNQIFQYAFLRSYADDLGFSFQNSKWIGDQIFNVKAGIDNSGKGLRKILQSQYGTENCDILNCTDRLANADINGYFQYDMKIHSLHKEGLLKDFSFKGDYLKRANHIASVLEAQKGITVGLHLRRGDYGTGIFYIAPNRWYLEWLEKLKEKHNSMTIFIASDDLGLVLKDFTNYNVITASEFGKDASIPDFFDDFAALTLCKRLAISNSTFSFAAALFNTQADEFLRPDLQNKSLVSFDPWTSEPLLRAEIAEKHGEEFMNKRAKSRNKYKIRKLFGFDKS